MADLPSGVGTHPVHCAYCQKRFDLFAATWCKHTSLHPSKVCPRCRRCLCRHPLYVMSYCWRTPSSEFRSRGFERVFLLYVTTLETA